MSKSAWAVPGSDAAAITQSFSISSAQAVQTSTQAEFQQHMDAIKVCIKKLEAIAAGAKDQNPDLAKQLQDFHERFNAGSASACEAVNILMQLVTCLVGKFDALVEAKQQQAEEISALKQEISALKQQVTDLQEKTKKILLGQLAYAVDYAATQFVYGQGSSPSHVSLPDIRVSALAGDLSAEEQRRFELFREYLQRNGFRMDRAVNLTGMVRKQRCTAAHGTPEQHSSTTAESLMAWAEELELQGSAEDFKALISLAQLFSVEGKPLLKKAAHHIIGQMQSFSTVRCHDGGSQVMACMA